MYKTFVGDNSRKCEYNRLIGSGINGPSTTQNTYLNIGYNAIHGYMTANGTNTGTSDNSASPSVDGSLQHGNMQCQQ